MSDTNVRKGKVKLEGLYIFFLIYALFIMLFFTQSSPLFVMNMWVDSNAFFTMGKGMVHGLVPYQDLFEQKGPLLYFIHALAYMISRTSFFGVYIMESIAMFANLLLAYKITRLYLKWMPSVIVAMFLPLVILNEAYFIHGDSAEEFSIPFYLTFFYLLLKHFKYKPEASFKWWFYLINGVLIGCVLLIKYTLVGGWIGFYFAVLLVCLWKRNWRELLNAIIYTFAGIMIAFLPWLIYFGVNGAINDFVEVYIGVNVFSYSFDLSLPGKLANVAMIFGSVIDYSIEIKLLLLLGIFYFLFSKKYLSTVIQKLTFFSIFIFLVLGVYYGGRDYAYYFLIIAPYGYFGLLAIGDFIQHLHKSDKEVLTKGRWFTLSIVAIGAVFLCFAFNTNIKQSKLFVFGDLPQETFAEVMGKEQNPTLLNYGELDGGFYLLNDIVPNVRYFERQNLDYDVYPENMDEQHRYIKEGLVQFVVFKQWGSAPKDPATIPNLTENYKLVSQQEQIWNQQSYTFMLFKRNE